MNTSRHVPLHRFLAPFLILGLVVTACAQSPTAAPTQRPAPTTAPVKPVATQAPPTKPAPTAAPTQKPAPNASPTQKIQPTTAPTAAPTTAPATGPTAQPTPRAEALGTGHLVGDLLITPSKSEQMTQSGTEKPQSGDVFAVVTVQLQNTSKTATIKFDPANLLLMDAASSTNLSPVTLKSLKNQLGTQELKPGAKIEGVVVYEAPKKDTQWELLFKGSNDQKVFWSLSQPPAG
jgi:cell wall-associated NlpC family hydrolase